MTNSTQPPDSLSTAAKKWWRAIQSEFAIADPGGLLVLTTALEAYDRMVEAKALIDEQGLTVLDRFEQRKPHPAVVIERDCRGQMLMALRHLSLDLEPLETRPGRPDGSRG